MGTVLPPEQNIFPSTFKSLKLFVTIPVTSCTYERTFSKLNIVKTKLRSTMGRETLDCLLNMFIEQDQTCNVNYEDDIEVFKTLDTTVKRRMEL